MTSAEVIPAVVLKRKAVVYVRQSTQSQVMTNLESDAGMIEVEIDGVTVRVGRGADAKTVTAVLRALKATA
jgi:transposase